MPGLTLCGRHGCRSASGGSKQGQDVAGEELDWIHHSMRWCMCSLFHALVRVQLL